MGVSGRNDIWPGLMDLEPSISLWPTKSLQHFLTRPMNHDGSSVDEPVLPSLQNIALVVDPHEIGTAYIGEAHAERIDPECLRLDRVAKTNVTRQTLIEAAGTEDLIQRCRKVSAKNRRSKISAQRRAYTEGGREATFQKFTFFQLVFKLWGPWHPRSVFGNFWHLIRLLLRDARTDGMASRPKERLSKDMLMESHSGVRAMEVVRSIS